MKVFRYSFLLFFFCSYTCDEMSSASRRACVHCDKADIGELSGYRSFRCFSGSYFEEHAFLCSDCASVVKAEKLQDRRVAPSTIAYDGKLEKRAEGLYIVTLKSERAVSLRLARLPATSVSDGLNDEEYAQRLRRAEGAASEFAAVTFDTVNVVESHLLDIGSHRSTPHLCRYLIVRARNMVFESSATAAAAPQRAIDELFQVVSPATMEASWTLVSALRECVCEVQEGAPPPSPAARASEPADVPLKDVEATAVHLTSVAMESPLFFGAVLHALFQRHTSVVTTLLHGVDKVEAAEGAAKRDDVVNALSELLASGTHLMVVAATRQRHRALINQDQFWDAVVHCGAIASKHKILSALRQSWPDNVETQRTFNVYAYLTGFQQHLGIFLSSFWGRKRMFNRSFGSKGQKKSAEPALDGNGSHGVGRQLHEQLRGGSSHCQQLYCLPAPLLFFQTGKRSPRLQTFFCEERCGRASAANSFSTR